MDSKQRSPHGSSSTSEYSLPSSLSASDLGKTLFEATQRVLRRRFRVVLLIREAYEHMTANEDVLSAVWDDLRASLRLLLAWVDRSYQQVSWGSLVILVAALVYFVTPVDIIPDTLGALGFVDDVAVISTAVETVRTELERFRSWEETPSESPAS